MKVECRDKRKSYFQLGYAETNPITNIVKGERRGKYSKILPLGKTKLKQSLFCSALAYLYLCIRMQKRENVYKSKSLCGVTLQYNIEGDGYPVILMHGWGCNHTTVQSIERLLSPHFKVYTISTFPDSAEVALRPRYGAWKNIRKCSKRS